MSNSTLIDSAIENTSTSIISLPPEYPSDFQTIRHTFGGNREKYNNLQRGVAILKEEDELQQYLFSFGNMHEAKLKKVYTELFKKLSLRSNDKIEVIDYACGQGLASIVLLNYLETYDSNYPLSNLLKIILIEPSRIALDKAKFFLKKSSNLLMVNKYLDMVEKDDLYTDHRTIKIHLFSNILDMADTHFDIDKITSSIKKSQSGINYFVCVSALNKNKLDSFMNGFEKEYYFENLASFDGCFDNEQQWKIKYNIFRIGI